MVYAYLLENTVKYRNLDNAEVFGAIKVYKLNEDFIFSDPIDSLERPELMKLEDLVRSGDTIVLRSSCDLCNNGIALIRPYNISIAEGFNCYQCVNQIMSIDITFKCFTNTKY